MSADTDLITTSSSAPPGIKAAFRRIGAPADLRAFFTEIIGYEEQSDHGARQIETASLTVPLVLSFGHPFEIGIGHQPTHEDAVPSFLAGLSDRPVFIQSDGRAKCVQINFTPLGARHFFDLPMSLLTDRMEPIIDLADPTISDFIRYMEDTEDWSARMRIASEFVCARLRRLTIQPGPVDHVLRRLMESEGRLPISRLGAEVGWSRKHLAMTFRRDIGLSPKVVARIIRFNKVLRLAGSAVDRNWSGIAADCGYADQAHLIRDFTALSGQSPTSWQRRHEGTEGTDW